MQDWGVRGQGRAGHTGHCGAWKGAAGEVQGLAGGLRRAQPPEDNGRTTEEDSVGQQGLPGSGTVQSNEGFSGGLVLECNLM